jgi:hypothetical protein
MIFLEITPHPQPTTCIKANEHKCTGINEEIIIHILPR